MAKRIIRNLLLLFMFFLSSNQIFSAELADTLTYEYLYAYKLETDSSMVEEGQDLYQYMEKYSFPVVSGMKNTQVQDSINHKVSNNIRSDMQSSIIKDELHYTDEPGFDALPMPRDYSSASVFMHEFNEQFLTYSESYEWDGGAHPSFSFNGIFSIKLANGDYLRIADILNPGWMPYFIEAVKSNESLSEFASDGIVDDNTCEDVKDAVIELVKTFNDTTAIAVEKEALFVFVADYRDFGCPEISRGVFEIKIGWDVLEPLLIKDIIYPIFPK